MQMQTDHKTTHFTTTDFKTHFLKGTTSRKLLVLNCVLSLAYFIVITFAFQHGNMVLFSLLIAGEVFHLFQIIGYSLTIWGKKRTALFDGAMAQPVDVFITVAGEPVEIVEETARAAKAMDYPNHQVYLLNDSYVAKKDNWREYEELARRLGIGCITRTVPGGAKAGNINNALRETGSPFVAIFDADHVPYKNFLQETMGYFADKRMGFIQTPQYYKNQTENMVTQTAWDQQTIFFGPIMTGKNRTNSAFMCGTNMIFRRQAVNEVGGMCEFNIAEDFLTSLFLHNKKWNSLYIPKVLAEGLAPEDFLSYYKQQFRWTRGSLEVIFKYNPLFMRGLSWQQRLQYLVSASYYLSGIVVLIDALLPVVFLLTGITAVVTSTMFLAMVFLPYILLSLFVLQASTNFSYTYRAISFSLSSFYIQLKAVVAVLRGQKTSFAVTSKQQLEGNFLYLATPQILYIILVAVATLVGLHREGLSASLIANLAWACANIVIFLPFIAAAAPSRWHAKIMRRVARAFRLRTSRQPQPEVKLGGAE